MEDLASLRGNLLAEQVIVASPAACFPWLRAQAQALAQVPALAQTRVQVAQVRSWFRRHEELWSWFHRSK